MEGDSGKKRKAKFKGNEKVSANCRKEMMKKEKKSFLVEKDRRKRKYGDRKMGSRGSKRDVVYLG